MAKLTMKDLEAALISEKRLGSLGYSERDLVELSKAQKTRLDKVAIERANELGWSFDELVAWVDSKNGRWFWDEAYGMDDVDAAKKMVDISWMDDYERSLYGI